MPAGVFIVGKFKGKKAHEVPECQFCHRSLVAEWLRDAGFEVEEFGTLPETEEAQKSDPVEAEQCSFLYA